MPKKNPTAQGQDLDDPAANTPTLKVPHPYQFPVYPLSISALGSDGDLANFFVSIK